MPAHVGVAVLPSELFSMSLNALPSLPPTGSSESVGIHAATASSGGRAIADFIPSADQIQAEIDAAFAQELSPELSQWVERYSSVGRRNPYLWKWCRQAVSLTTLPCVAEALYEEHCDTKTLGVVLDVLLDDVADQKVSLGPRVLVFIDDTTHMQSMIDQLLVTHRQLAEQLFQADQGRPSSQFIDDVSFRLGDDHRLANRTAPLRDQGADLHGTMQVKQDSAAIEDPVSENQ
jgi:hypothetical protein